MTMQGQGPQTPDTQVGNAHDRPAQQPGGAAGGGQHATQMDLGSRPPDDGELNRATPSKGQKVMGWIVMALIAIALVVGGFYAFRGLKRWWRGAASNVASAVRGTDAGTRTDASADGAAARNADAGVTTTVPAPVVAPVADLITAGLKCYAPGATATPALPPAARVPMAEIATISVTVPRPAGWSCRHEDQIGVDIHAGYAVLTGTACRFCRIE